MLSHKQRGSDAALEVRAAFKEFVVKVRERQRMWSASVQHQSQPQRALASVAGHLVGIVGSLRAALQATSCSPDLHRAVAGRQDQENHTTIPPSWTREARLLPHSLGGGEEVAAVGGDAVDGALVTFHLAQSPQRVRVPQLEHPAPAAAQQDGGRRDHAQRAHPVPVGVGDLLRGENRR